MMDFNVETEQKKSSIRKREDDQDDQRMIKEEKTKYRNIMDKKGWIILNSNYRRKES